MSEVQEYIAQCVTFLFDQGLMQAEKAERKNGKFVFSVTEQPNKRHKRRRCSWVAYCRTYSVELQIDLCCAQDIKGIVEGHIQIIWHQNKTVCLKIA